MHSEKSVTLSGLISYLWTGDYDYDDDEEEVNDDDSSYKVLGSYITAPIYSILKPIIWGKYN